MILAIDSNTMLGLSSDQHVLTLHVYSMINIFHPRQVRYPDQISRKLQRINKSKGHILIAIINTCATSKTINSDPQAVIRYQFRVLIQT